MRRRALGRDCLACVTQFHIYTFAFSSFAFNVSFHFQKWCFLSMETKCSVDVKDHGESLIDHTDFVPRTNDRRKNVKVRIYVAVHSSQRLSLSLHSPSFSWNTKQMFHCRPMHVYWNWTLAWTSVSYYDILFQHYKKEVQLLPLLIIPEIKTKVIEWTQSADAHTH